MLESPISDKEKRCIWTDEERKMTSLLFSMSIIFLTTIKGRYYVKKNTKKKFHIFTWTICSFTNNAYILELDGLSKIDLRIPRYVQAGDSADLVCSYYLDSHNLYSVKWYKGRHEFYRFMPHETPPVRVFPVKEMKINVSGGNKRLFHRVPLSLFLYHF